MSIFWWHHCHNTKSLFNRLKNNLCIMMSRNVFLISAIFIVYSLWNYSHPCNNNDVISKKCQILVIVCSRSRRAFSSILISTLKWTFLHHRILMGTFHTFALKVDTFHGDTCVGADNFLGFCWWLIRVINKILILRKIVISRKSPAW